jgi:hypothetical protein
MLLVEEATRSRRCHCPYRCRRYSLWGILLSRSLKSKQQQCQQH